MRSSLLMSPAPTGPTPNRLTFVRVSMWYALALVVAMACGAALAIAVGERVQFVRDESATLDPAAVFAFIVRENGRMWLYVCLGVVSFGAAGFVALIGNGFRFGMDAALVAQSAPAELPFLLPHATVEFASFTLAAAACQYLGLLLLELLVFDRRRAPVSVGVHGLMWSACLLLLAAFVETVSRMARPS